MRYTLAADANLDLQVDTLDFNALAADFGTTGQRWSHGDFNYDGVIDTLDFNALARNFGQPLPAAIARNAAGATGSASGRDGTIIPVPEPAGLAGALLCAVGVLPRRRRR